MDFWWRLIGVLFFCTGLSHAGSNFGIPPDYSGQFYCCVESDNQPALFLTAGNRCVHLWMHLKIEPRSDRDGFILRRMLFLRTTEVTACKKIDRALLAKIARLLDADQDAKIAVSLEHYTLSEYGYIENFKIYGRTDSTSQSLTDLINTPDSQYSILVSSYSKNGPQTTSKSWHLRLGNNKVIPTLFLPMAPPSKRDCPACYDPLHESHYFEYYREDTHIRPLPMQSSSDAWTLDIKELMTLKLFRDNTTPGLPEKIVLSLPHSLIPSKSNASLNLYRNELELTFKATSPDSDSTTLPACHEATVFQRVPATGRQWHQHEKTSLGNVKITRQMTKGDVAAVISNLNSFTNNISADQCPMPYNHTEIIQLSRLHYSNLQPDEKKIIIEYINRLISRQMPQPKEYNIAFIKALIHFMREYNELLQHLDHKNSDQLQTHRQKCYEALSKREVKQICKELEELEELETVAEAKKHHLKLVTSVEALGEVCQLHQQTLPQEAVIFICSTLSRCAEQIIELLNTEVSEYTLEKLPVRLASAILNCWFIIPDPSITDQKLPLSQINLLPHLTSCYQNYTTLLRQHLIQEPILESQEIKTCISQLQSVRGIWEQQKQKTVLDQLLAELESLPSSAIEWPDISGQQSEPYTNSQIQPDTDFHTEKPALPVAVAQTAHFNTPPFFSAPEKHPKKPLLDNPPDYLRAFAAHMPAFKASLDAHLQHMLSCNLPDLNNLTLNQLQALKRKLQTLTSEDIHDELLSEHIKRIDGYLFVAMVEQATKTQHAAQLEWLTNINKKWDQTFCQVLNTKGRNRLNRLTVEVVVQNMRRIQTMLTDGIHVTEALLEKREVNDFLNAHSIIFDNSRVARLTATIESQIQDKAYLASDWYHKQSHGYSPPFSAHAPVIYPDTIATCYQHFAYLDSWQQLDISQTLHSILTTRVNFCSHNPALFLPFRRHSVIANSPSGDFIKYWEYRIHHKTGAWDIEWPDFLTENIFLTLFNFEHSNNPRFILYGSQLSLALISCIYQVDAKAIGITPSDIDIICDKNDLQTALQLITKTLSPPSIPHNDISKVVQIYEKEDKLTEAERKQEIALGNYTMYVDIKGYDCSNIKRSLSVTIIEKTSSKLCCKIDLVPHNKSEMPPLESCCLFTTKKWQRIYQNAKHRPLIKGIGVDSLFQRLSLGLSAPETETGIKSKQLERFKKSHHQLECWLRHEKQSPRLQGYSIHAPHLLYRLEQQCESVGKLLNEREKATFTGAAIQANPAPVPAPPFEET